jgi:hypothetical protein
VNFGWGAKLQGSNEITSFIASGAAGEFENKQESRMNQTGHQPLIKSSLPPHRQF